MYIQDEVLRKKLKTILLTTSRNEIVTEIKAMGHKFHQFNIDRFLSGRPVSLETLKKIDAFVEKSLI